jgi:hypothetical protein
VRHRRLRRCDPWLRRCATVGSGGARPSAQAARPSAQAARPSAPQGPAVTWPQAVRVAGGRDACPPIAGPSPLGLRQRPRRCLKAAAPPQVSGSARRRGEG